MASDFANLWKSRLPNAFKKIILAVKSNKITVILGAFLLTAALLAPSFLFFLFFDKNQMGKNISGMSETNAFSVSYAGISSGWFNKIIIHDFRLLPQLDSNKSRESFNAPEIILVTDFWASVKTKSIVIKKIILKNARWKFSYEGENSEQFLKGEAEKLLKKYKDFHIELKNNLFSIVYEKKNYEREKFNLLTDNGTLVSDKGKLQFDLAYNDLPWGKGTIKAELENCDHCSILSGSYDIKSKNFPINRLSWFFPDYKLTDGFIDLRAKIRYQDNPGQEKTGISLRFELSDLAVFDLKDYPVLKNERFNTEAKYSKNNNETRVTFNGDWNKAGFKGVYEKEDKDLWPKTLTFALDNKSDHDIPLPYGFILEGLKEAKFEILEDPKKTAYRNLNGLLDISSGKLVNPQGRIELSIPNVHINLNANKADGKIALVKGQSDLDFSFSGDIKPYTRLIENQIENANDEKIKSISSNGVAFELNETGNLKAGNLYWRDFQEYYNNLDDIWKSKTANEQFAGWKPSLLRERSWFQKYFLRSYFENKVEIGNWFAGEKEPPGFTVSGNLNYIGSVLDLTLTHDEQRFYFGIDATNNYPLLRSEYNLEFKNDSKFSDLWLAENLFGSYNELTVNGHFSTSGERAIDIQENLNGSDTCRLTQAVFMHDLKNKSSIWNQMNLETRRYGSKIVINLNGENEEAAITAWGNYNEKGKKHWKLKKSVLQKPPKVNP